MLTKALIDLSPLADAALMSALLASGVVKGVLGVGLPLVAIPLATQFLEIPAAVALLTVPMIAANFRQALEGSGTLAAVGRLLPMLATLVLGTIIGAHLLVNIDRRPLNAIVGTSLLLLAVWLICLPKFRMSRRTAKWAGPAIGMLAGVFGGMSSMFGPPLIAYLVGSGADPNTFIKHMAILALVATVTLVLTLGGTGSLSPIDVLVSAAAVIPIHLGMALGRWLRRYVPPLVFRAAVLGVLALAGISMLRRAFS